MNDNTYIDTSAGARSALLDEDGAVVILAPQSCTARQGKLRCILDKVHSTGLKTPHVHRDEDGKLISWRHQK